jgi:hypothetical protein
MLTLITLIALLSGAPKVDYNIDAYIDVGIATTFSSDDLYNPNNITACYPHKKLDDNALVIAHRSLPCNTKVVICNKRTDICTSARVVDRGPYGLTSTRAGLRHTSIVDMTMGVAKKIHHNGFEEVVLFAPKKIDKRIIRVKGVRVRKVC